jgi:hypothetical protein
VGVSLSLPNLVTRIRSGHNKIDRGQSTSSRKAISVGSSGSQDAIAWSDDFDHFIFREEMLECLAAVRL